MDNQEQILSFMRGKGPILPVELAKELKTNILFASAHLSELSSSKKVKISTVKIGGSPLYYLPGQETMLQKFSDNLQEKDKRAYEAIKENKVMREKELAPLMKVTLRAIKDYAVPLEVHYKDQKEIFWKWYLLSDQEAQEHIKKHLTAEAEKMPSPEAKQEIKKEPSEDIDKAVEKKLREKESIFKQEVQERLDLIKKQYEDEITKLKQEQFFASEKMKEEKKMIEAEKRAIETEKKQMQVQKKQIVPQDKKPAIEKSIVQPIRPEQPTAQQLLVPDPYLDSLKPFFQQKRIEVIKSEVIKKKAEINLILKVPSQVGIMEYYAKAKNKKKINEADLSMAFLEGREKNLPTLFISQGEMTKKAKLLLETKLKGMAFVKV